METRSRCCCAGPQTMSAARCCGPPSGQLTRISSRTCCFSFSIRTVRRHRRRTRKSRAGLARNQPRLPLPSGAAALVAETTEAALPEGLEGSSLMLSIPWATIRSSRSALRARTSIFSWRAAKL